jgi:hypothetical protein
MLSLDDIVLEDETTQTSKSHVIDEFGSSTRCRKHRYSRMCYYIVLFCSYEFFIIIIIIIILILFWPIIG